MKRLLIILLALMPLVGISDQIYRWTDEKGVVHFSSKPLDESLGHDLIPLPDSPTPTPGAQISVPDENNTDDQQPVESSLQSSSQSPSQSSSQSSSQLSKEEIEYCKKLKINIETLKNSHRVRIQKANGEFEALGDKGKKTEMDRLKKLMKEFC